MQQEHQTSQPSQPSQPPHHISDIDAWKGADRNFYIFAILSILFGFIGVDHFYLRSFGTGTQKALMNFATLGLWYWWDIAQIMTQGKKVRNEGLSSPFDWILGIGRGVFEPLPDPSGLQDGGSRKQYPAQKSYLIYAFLAIFLGWLGADKFYLGYTGQGIAKVLSCFNIFLFLFGWLWVMWDSVFAFFFTTDIMKHGISAPMPYSLFFREPIPPTLFEMNHAPSEENRSFWDWLTCPPIPSFLKSWFPSVESAKEVYNGVVKPLLTPPVTAALAAMEHLNPDSVKKVEDIAHTVRQIGGSREQQPPQNDAMTAMTTMTTMTTSDGAGAGGVIAGTLTALLIAGGLKGTYDFISKQYG
jgi:TM2 domain-containing membrane protein YozV